MFFINIYDEKHRFKRYEINKDYSKHPENGQINRLEYSYLCVRNHMKRYYKVMGFEKKEFLEQLSELEKKLEKQ